MATHFARGILNDGQMLSVRLSTTCHNTARELPTHRRTRYLASRALLAELIFMLYGIGELPEIINQPNGRPVFKDPNLPDFSLSYAGNIVGVALTTEGKCGLDLELQRSAYSLSRAQNSKSYGFTSNEKLWIKNQNDANEAQVQLLTLRHSILKLTGEIHTDQPELLQLLPGSGRLRSASMAQLEALSDAEDVLVWSLAATPAIEKLKIWQFDGRNGWQSLPDAQTRANAEDARLMRFTSLSAEKALILN
ncbi:4'-phosphopantetheinyl transferase family protein [Pseudocitrobacter cyperus]|uniref:Phosphopantetheinyl transferase n=1 Tax=Pseudocitrobacter cyperus TaxID=3112843 RepID=A0ABV0HLK3_9ENTR